jgi:virginiamycin B lyase
VDLFPLAATATGANLNTAAFDAAGVRWFMGQSGYCGRLDLRQFKVEAWAAPCGYGPYGITSPPNGGVYYASLVGNCIVRVDPASGKVTPIDPTRRNQGARRVCSDSQDRVW